MINVTVYAAFAAGFVSFLAPCVLPIIPGFLAYLAGSSLDGKGANRREIFFNSVFFVLGFSVVFAALGVLLNSILIHIAGDVSAWLSRAGGVMIIFFGLYLMGLIKISYFEQEHKFAVKTKFKSRYVTSFLFGLAFAAGWTPCVGPALGAILGLATAAPGSAFYLLFAYAIGLGIPFMIVGLFASQAAVLINKYAGVVFYINIAFGLLLVVLGILIFTQELSLIANFSFLNNYLLQK